MSAAGKSKPRRWTVDHPDGGRLDVDGNEWFACDPYPTWYRRENGELITRGDFWRNSGNMSEPKWAK